MVKLYIEAKHELLFETSATATDKKQSVSSKLFIWTFFLREQTEDGGVFSEQRLLCSAPLNDRRQQ